MSDTSGQNLAIVEKRVQRPGGCVGIFFQLFDWNRRFAKKKLFSKKLLPSARTKRISKKFGRDEKLPVSKLLLIADENRGGFPNAKKTEIESSHKMRAPGLVAKLMGLESMPAVPREKPKKACFSELNHAYEKKSASNNNVGTSEPVGCDHKDFPSEKGFMKLDSRPEKFQKTGLFDRQINRFGSEPLQFRSVLSHSRKHHQPKLASPIKSSQSGRNATRLMEAATKILKPGLQATNREKCALAYSPSLHFAPKDEVMVEETTSYLTSDQSKLPSCYSSGAKSLKGQSSCQSCGNWLDVVDSRSTVGEHVLGFASTVSDIGIAPSQGSGRSKLKSSISSFEQERDVVVPKNKEKPVCLGTEAKANARTRSRSLINGKPQFQEAQNQPRMLSQRIKSQKEVASASGLKQRTQEQSQKISLAKDRVAPRLKTSNQQRKRDSFTIGSVNGDNDFVALNQNSTSCTRARIPSKASGNSMIDRERNAWDKRENSSSRLRASVHKRRPPNGNIQVGHAGSTGKQMNVRGDVLTREMAGLDACSLKQNGVKSESLSEAKGAAAGSRKEVDVVSFMFSSPMRHTTESSLCTESMEKAKVQGEIMSSSASYQKMLTLDANIGNPSSQMEAQFKGDSLGALLEEKLKELTCQDRDDFKTVEALSGRSTASILEELIYALTSERPSTLEDGAMLLVECSQEESFCYGSQDPSNGISFHGQMFNSNKKHQADAKSAGVLVGFPLAGDGDQPSPGSVLDAAFSNDSCFSESLDGSSRHKLQLDPMECSYDQLLPSELDGELSDCATSLNTESASYDRMLNSLNNVPSLLCGIDPADIGLEGNELSHAREVIVNAGGMLFRNTSQCDADGMQDFQIAPLLEQLEILLNALWTSPKCTMGFMEAKGGCQRWRFLFDCVIECLDSKYGHYCKSRFKTLPKLQLCINGDFLVREICEEIRRWANLVGKTADEIIEREMSQSLGEWVDFEIEALETGTEIENEILQVLVDEIVIDLRQCMAGSS